MQRSSVPRSIKTSFIIILTILFWKGLTPASESYELVDEWGSYGSGDGQFASPYGIAIDEGDILYVSDASNQHIQKFTSQGEFITKWGSYGSEDGEFICPWGLDIDSTGNVYVADMYNDRIQKFTSDGDFITKWSPEVKGVWLGSLLRGVAVDNAGNVYMQHTSFTPPVFNGSIQKFTSDGIFIKKWTIFWGMLINEIATDNERNVYIPSLFFGPLQKFTPDGDLIGEWSTCSITDPFCTNAGIAIDHDGNVYVSDSLQHCIKKFTPDGELITRWELKGSGEFSSPSSPQGLAVDNEGHVYVADTKNDCILKYAKVTDTTTTTISCPSGIALYDNSYQLKLFRDFRDGVLANTPRGEGFIDLYYRYSSEVSSLLLSDDGLRTKTGNLLIDLLPIVESILGDEEVVLSKELVTRIESLLNEIGSKASPQLRAGISTVKGEIRKTDFLERLGIALID